MLRALGKPWEVLGLEWGWGMGRTLTEAGAGWIHQRSSNLLSGP